MSTTLKIVVSNAETSCLYHQKKIGGLSSPQGLLQASHKGLPSACLESRQTGMFVHSQCPWEEAVIFQVVYTSRLPQNPASLHAPAGSSRCELPASGSGDSCSAAAVLSACPGSCGQCPSPLVVTQLPPCQPALLQLQGISSSFWEQTDSSEVDWHSVQSARRLHMGPCPMATECHVCVSFVGRVN